MNGIFCTAGVRDLQCPADWHKPEHSIGSELQDCGLPCSYFSSYEKWVASIIVGVIAGITLLSSLLTIVTACVDPSRFQYPERAIVHIAICYAALALGYIVSVWSRFSSYECI